MKISAKRRANSTEGKAKLKRASDIAARQARIIGKPGLRGHKQSQETIEKRRKALTGKNVPSRGWSRGKRRPEHSSKLKELWSDPVWRAKMLAARRKD